MLFLSMTLIYFSIVIIDLKENRVKPDNDRIFYPDLNILSEASISVCIRLMQIIGVILGAIINIFLSVLYVVLLIGYFNYNKQINKNKWAIRDFLIFHVITYTILFTVGWIFTISESTFTNLNLIEFISVFIGYISSFISLCLIVYMKEIDKSNKLNDRKIPIISTILLLLSAIFSLFNKDPLLSVITITLVPFYFYGVIRFSDKDITRIIRYSIFIHIFFCFTVYPLFCIPHIIIFYFAKYYYWHKYDIHFPAFAID